MKFLFKIIIFFLVFNKKLEKINKKYLKISKINQNFIKFNNLLLLSKLRDIIFGIGEMLCIKKRGIRHYFNEKNNHIIVYTV